MSHWTEWEKLKTRISARLWVPFLCYEYESPVAWCLCISVLFTISKPELLPLSGDTSIVVYESLTWSRVFMLEPFNVSQVLCSSPHACRPFPKLHWFQEMSFSFPINGKFCNQQGKAWLTGTYSYFPSPSRCRSHATDEWQLQRAHFCLLRVPYFAKTMMNWMFWKMQVWLAVWGH